LIKKLELALLQEKSKLFKTMQRYFFLLILIFLLPLSLSGVEPDEILKDKILEERARIISSDLRCLVCQNENIDSSNADLAKDLRLLVRERLLVGDTNKQVKNFIVERYGEYVLLNPTFSGSSILLWISGPLIFILSFIILILRYLSFRKKNITKQVAHSAEDLKKLTSFLKK
jgi:cytochrome c-type biogenesis protein CcmH|tara:strand:+ start:821 stop:1339 length:519 start_codon:yes stop_codon:yes gene_type:complete